MQSKILDQFERIGLYTFYGLLAYMPFHILISTTLGIHVGGLEILKVLKDIILMIGFLITAIVFLNKLSIKTLFKDKLVLLIAVYAVLTVILPFFRQPELQAEIIGTVYNLRFLLFFVYGLILARLYNPAVLQQTALKIVVYSAVIVAGFGVIQYLFLPDKFFEALGYSKANGVLPAFYIDDKPDLERIMSTVRDPNSLGSYLLISTGLLMGLVVRAKNKHRKVAISGMLSLVLLATFLTFSRSAWLGTIVTALTFAAGYIAVRYRIGVWIKQHVGLVGVIAAIVLIAGGALYSARNSYFVQNVIFHADESTALADPNELRLMFWRNAVNDIRQNPIGYGPGSSGFSSIKNEKQQVIFTENYYLQIGREVGVLGLLLFLSIILLTGWRLIKTYIGTKNIIVLSLIAGFAGLAISNLFAHIWFNEAVAYTWWGLASLYLLPGIVKNKPRKK